MSEAAMKNEFLHTFDTYSDAIFRFCYGRTSDPERAEDLTQETFMRYWQVVRSGREITNVRAFLFTIARHAIIDWYRKQKADSLDDLQAAGYEPSDTGTANDPYHLAQHGEVVATMQRLSADDRELLLLRHVEGMEPRDIATVLGIQVNAVSVRIHRAEKRLRKLMSPTV